MAYVYLKKRNWRNIKDGDFVFGETEVAYGSYKRALLAQHEEITLAKSTGKLTAKYALQAKEMLDEKAGLPQDYFFVLKDGNVVFGEIKKMTVF